MLDLKKIEDQVDALLASETPESLKKWYHDRKSEELSKFLGSGEWMELPMSLEMTLENFSKIMPNWSAPKPEPINDGGNTQYAMAA